MAEQTLATVEEGTLLWQPSATAKQRSRLTDYMRWLEARTGRTFARYDDLWQWSVDDLGGFWGSIADYFGVTFATPPQQALADRTMPGARWFPGAELNYVEHVFRQANPSHPALVFQSETRPLVEVSWAKLEAQVAAAAAGLRALGVERGDRVVAFVPNIPETVVAFLATVSLGAVWSSCSPDFGVEAVLDRFAQIEPKVLFAVDGYTYGGKTFAKHEAVRGLQQGLPTLEHTISVPNLGQPAPPGTIAWSDLLQHRGATLRPTPVPFEHPLWIVYSSGTTGLPKALVHGQGGIVLEHLKVIGLHNDIQPGDRLFWYSSTGWMMWNYCIGALLVGATAVLYDGSPAYPSLDVLWSFAERAKINLFGTSAAYIMNCLKAGLEPGRQHDLTALRSIGSTGSPLPVEGFLWAYAAVKRDLWLASISGGTDVASAFVGGCPLLPVYAGELQCRALGANVQSFDEHGQPLIGQTGELVVTEPMPSMPVSLWNDPAFDRYRASYFDVYPGVWRHGDWIKFSPRGTSVIQGRSDSTLNRQGIRIGTAEIYSAIESLPAVRDSLVIGLELPHGGYWMPLFVVLAEGVELDDSLRQQITSTVRTQFSPRHVPDAIYAVPAIPRTLSDKKMEIPVKRLFAGVPIERAANVGATKSPDAVAYFADLAQRISPLLGRS